METRDCTRIFRRLGTWSTVQTLLHSAAVCKTRLSSSGQWLWYSPACLSVCGLVQRLIRRLLKVPVIKQFISALSFISRKLWSIITLIYFFLRPFTHYLVLIILSGSLLLNVYGFSTPWWIFIEEFYSEPCYHIQGLWDTCIMTERREVIVCESSTQFEQEHAPSSYVNSCGQSPGVSLSWVMYLETLGVILATISEIVMLQPFVEKPRPLCKKFFRHLPLTICLLTAGTVTLAGICLCLHEIEKSTRPNFYIHIVRSTYVSGLAGCLYILAGVMTVLI